VIVDLAGEAGGNCGFEPGESILRHDVKILAPLNVPSTLASTPPSCTARTSRRCWSCMIEETRSADFEDEIIAGRLHQRAARSSTKAKGGRGRECPLGGIHDVVTTSRFWFWRRFVGFEVISKGSNTLHTPLMSGTNAIHGIVVLGGLLLSTRHGWLARVR